MADITARVLNVSGPGGAAVMKTLKDMGDGTYAEVVSVSGITLDAQGLEISPAQNYDTNGDPMPNGMPTAYAYNGDGTVDTMTQTNGVDSWVMTFGYSNGRVTSDSGWVKA